MTLTQANKYVWSAVVLLAVLLVAGIGCILANAQTTHDAAEYAMQHELFEYKAQIADIWHPSKRLMSDYQAASNCYTRFHLGRVTTCRKQLDKVRADLVVPGGVR